MASYLIKWSNGEKRQEEEAEVVAATQKRKMLCKTRRGNLVITVCRSLSIHLAAFAARDQIFKDGNYGGSYSPEPVDDTMPGNKFHCKNKKYILFVLFSYVFKS